MKNIIAKLTCAAPLLFAVLIVNPAHAKVAKQDDDGFLITYIAEVKATPTEIWARLTEPKKWWDAAYSWSGSSDGFYLEPRAGGCFCEYLPAEKGKEKASIGGSVEHLRVIQINPGKVLRLQGALGPMQSEAVLGTLTIAMRPSKAEGSSMVSFNYIVGGYMRFPVGDAAKGMDKVIGAHFNGLLTPFKDRGQAEKISDVKRDEFVLDLDALDDNAEGAAKAEPEYVEKGR